MKMGLFFLCMVIIFLVYSTSRWVKELTYLNVDNTPGA